MDSLYDVYKREGNVKFSEMSPKLIEHTRINLARLSLGPSKIVNNNDLFSSISILNTLLGITDYRRTVINKTLAEFLIETKSPPKDLLEKSWAFRINYYFINYGYDLCYDTDCYNIVYLEGVNSTLMRNNDAPNSFNDLRALLTFKTGIPTLINYWDATTEPGKFYTDNPMNPRGAARIMFGQYKAWKVGYHGTSNPHLALVQCTPVKVHRDKNKDFSREGDLIDEGLFGINQHHGYDLPTDDIGRASAGCLVGRSSTQHKQFMDLILSDPRYKKDKNFVFTTTILPADRI